LVFEERAAKGLGKGRKSAQRSSAKSAATAKRSSWRSTAAKVAESQSVCLVEQGVEGE
jgi:hypothetical protein